MLANWSAIAFLLAAAGLVVFMLVVPRLLGGRSSGSQKQEIFEAGVVSAGSARIRLSAKFYLVAIFFVIFDLEALFLYAYAVSVREVNWLGFTAAAIFIAILFVGLVYEMRPGAMNWAPPINARKSHAFYLAPRILIWLPSRHLMALMSCTLTQQARCQRQSSGRINVSNDIKKNRAHMANIDHINTTGRVTTRDFRQDD